MIRHRSTVTVFAGILYVYFSHLVAIEEYAQCKYMRIGPPVNLNLCVNSSDPRKYIYCADRPIRCAVALHLMLTRRLPPSTNRFSHELKIGNEKRRVRPSFFPCIIATELNLERIEKEEPQQIMLSSRRSGPQENQEERIKTKTCSK